MDFSHSPTPFSSVIVTLRNLWGTETLEIKIIKSTVSELNLLNEV